MSVSGMDDFIRSQGVSTLRQVVKVAQEEIDKRKADADALYQRTVERLDAEYQLVYVAYDDKFSDEQLQLLLNGDVGELVEDCENGWLLDHRHHSVSQIIQDLLSDEDRAALGDFDLLDELRGEIEERDTSDWISDLLRNTPRTLMTVELGCDVPYYTEITDESLPGIVAAMAEAAGIDLDANRDLLTEAVQHASYGGKLVVIWYGDAADAIGAVRGTWTDPYLLVLDSYNGSGHDVKVSGTVTRDLAPGDIKIDSQAGAYSWDQIAGVHKPAYACDVRFERAATE